MLKVDKNIVVNAENEQHIITLVQRAILKI